MAIPILTIFSAMIAFLVWQQFGPGEGGNSPGRDPAPSDEAQRRVAFVVGQLERICLSNLTTNDKNSVSASLRRRLRTIDATVASERAAEVARGASRALPPELQVSDGAEIRLCITQNFDKLMAAAQPLAHAPPPAGPKTVRPSWTSINDDWPESPGAASDFVRVRDTVLRQCGNCLKPKDESTIAPGGVSNSTGSRIAIDAKECSVGIRLALRGGKVMQAANAPMAFTQRYARVDIEPKQLTYILIDDVINVELSPLACLS